MLGRACQKHKRGFLLASALSVLTGAGACQSRTEGHAPAARCFGNSQSLAAPEMSAAEPCAGRSSGSFGIVLEFKEWPPASRDIPALVEQLNQEGLKDQEGFPLFQSCSFHWPGCQERERAERACRRLMSQFASFLKSCSSDNYLKPG